MPDKEAAVARGDARFKEGHQRGRLLGGAVIYQAEVVAPPETGDPTLELGIHENISRQNERRQAWIVAC
jgi:hypothetical protein